MKAANQDVKGVMIVLNFKEYSHNIVLDVVVHFTKNKLIVFAVNVGLQERKMHNANGVSIKRFTDENIIRSVKNETSRLL